MILIVDKSAQMFYRIKSMSQFSEHEPIWVNNISELLGIMNLRADQVELVILDIQFDENGFLWVERIKSKLPMVPLIILTTEVDRRLLVDTMKLGVSDYILKPIEDMQLSFRLQKYLGKQKSEFDSIINPYLDIRTYIEVEIYQAKKGKYPVSFFMFLFFKAVKQNDQVMFEYLKANEQIFSSLKKVLFRTDLLVHYGNQMYFGVFPFCDDAHAMLISKKMRLSFEQLKKENEYLKAYYIADVFSSFPKEDLEPTVVIEELIDKLKISVEHIRSNANC